MRRLLILTLVVLLSSCDNSTDTSSTASKLDSSVTSSNDSLAPTGITKCLPDANSALLAVTLFAQETPMWCWAASGQMCMSYFGKNVSQCEQAKNEFNVANCCGSSQGMECIQGGWPEFNKYGFSNSVTVDEPLSWDEIEHQISCLKKPVAFSWHWVGGGGHMMVLTGYNISNNERYVTILDPLPENVGSQSTILYDNYVAGVDHSHWNDYYNISRLN